MAVGYGRRELQKSKINERHTDPDSGAPYEIHLDEILSRRKRFHMIVDCEGGCVYRSKYVHDILEWLADHGQFSYLIRGAGLAWYCNMQRDRQDEGD
jgi:hypothetical protein